MLKAVETLMLAGDRWDQATFAYTAFALITLFPTLRAAFKKVRLHTNGCSFKDSLHFGDEEKVQLQQHYSRIHGTLVFWKNAAEKYRSFHYYCLLWTIPISVLIPIVTQAISDGNGSKLFLTVVSSHAAVLLGLHKGLKIENNFQAFRHGESEFYDLYRRVLDTPEEFGDSKREQMTAYFKQAELIRRHVRNAETDNFPSLEEATEEAKKD
ncbi:MAG: hypothetical protein QGH42_04565 [Kiritimatiellia bacterium]|jgi:hypothetical protein|nr:hypothetical protein [Kiritimatiellia bacterium]MDP6809642.1 hypothetical protein [Kiritimatiellia bacterium]MDP7023508.1 hypothetical protein [Kiritimatiellia bacterium]